MPVLEHGYWYYTRYVPGQDYPVYARRKGSMDAPEEVMLDGNAMAHGHEFFQIGSADVSPDGKLLAYAEDTVGRRQYVLQGQEPRHRASCCRHGDQRAAQLRLGQRQRDRCSTSRRIR